MGLYRFGKFELNEESRGLRLAGHDLDVQPLVFDFLAILLRHQDRALSKDELLDTLWPGVTVTEASLQRVASLTRGILRQGGLDTALRNLPRFGYRICLESPAGGGGDSTAKGPSDAPPAGPGRSVLEARAAVAARKWQDAAVLFAEADRTDGVLTADLEDWALATECCGHPFDAIALLTRAVAAYSMAAQNLRAVGPAVTLAKIHLERGELAVAKGWLKRAESLAGPNLESREFGLCCWMGARLAGADGETAQALALTERAYAIGKRLDDPVVEALGLIYRGFYKLCLGETEAGLADQDQAGALGLSSDIDPVAGGILYCNILWVCRNFGDWTRANQWTFGYERWCRDSGIIDLWGSCRLHRAEVLGVHGTLKEAEGLIRMALDQLADDAPWATGDALRVLGDIHRAAGDLAEAHAAYRASHAVGWDPQPGFALLQFEQGQAEDAYRGLERSLLATGWFAQQRRGLILATLAKVAARTGRTARAQEAIAELDTRPSRWPMPSIQALAAEAKAELFAQESRPADALREWQTACRLWTEIGSAINAADARLSLAGLLISLDDRAGAGLEIDTARSIAEKIASPRLLRRCRELAAAIQSDHRGAPLRNDRDSGPIA